MRIPENNLEDFKNGSLKLLLIFDGVDEIECQESIFKDLKIEEVSSNPKCIFSIRKNEIKEEKIKVIFDKKNFETIYICPLDSK